MQQRSTASVIRTSDMTVFRTFDVPNAFGDISPVDWVDDSSFLVYSSEVSGDVIEHAAWQGSVSDPALKEVVIPWFDAAPTTPIGLDNGHGAIAFPSGDESDGSCGNDACPRFKIWTKSSVSEDIEGWPTAWSLDGTRLAVVRPRPETGAADQGKHVLAAGNYFDAGWLEILNYPDLTPVYSNQNLLVADIDMAFSPSGENVLAEMQDGSADYAVVDLQTQAIVKVPSVWPTLWYGADELLSQTGGDLVARSLDGTVIQRWKDVGDGPLAVSPDGRMLVTTDHFRTPKYVDVVRDGQVLSFGLPDLAGLDGADLVMATPANDGRSIVLMTERPDNFGPLLVLQVPD